VSAFDDEFGLFGDENVEEEERKSTLGARTISTGETIIDEIEPEDERPARRRRTGPPEKREFTPIPGRKPQAAVGRGAVASRSNAIRCPTKSRTRAPSNCSRFSPSVWSASRTRCSWN